MAAARRSRPEAHRPTTSLSSQALSREAAALAEWTPPDWPFFGLEGGVEPFVLNITARGVAVALATITALDVGGPRPPGSQMAITAEGEVCGYLSGGCIEPDIVGHAAAVLADGRPRLLRYGKDGPFDLQLPCGGGMGVLLERLLPDDPVLPVWRARGRRELLWQSDGYVRSLRSPGPDDPPHAPVDWDGSRLRLRLPPPWRLIVAGHNPGALAIALLGAQVGFDTHVLRGGAAIRPPAPGITVHGGDPASSLRGLAPDTWTAVAVAGHDDAGDRAVLAAALPGAAGYVGLLGSRRRLAVHRAALREAGLSEAQLDRLHAPIGLDLRGKAPWEVALSVIGQITAHRNGGLTAP